MTSSTASIGSARVDEEQCLLHNMLLSIIEQKDTNFYQEISSAPFKQIPPPRNISDQYEMRQRVLDVLRLPREPKSKRIRSQATISVDDVCVSYQNTNTFSLRVYDPIFPDSEIKTLRPAVLMYHGGGWTHGLPQMDEEVSKFFASELRAVVFSIDYRLAPEHSFPLPLNDCYEALSWALNNASKYRINPMRIGLWGCSAGANLAAAVALRDCAENTIPRIKHVNLVVPVTCYPELYPQTLKSVVASPTKFGTGENPGIPLSAMQALWEIYCPANFSNPYTSVLHTIPPNNHPSVHITVCGRDTLRDEGIAYALHLRNHGIDTQLDIIPGIPHELELATSTHANRQYLTNQVRALNYALNTDF